MQRLINKETVTYLIFGVLTTAINYAVLYVWMLLFGNNTALSGNAVAFVLASSFAYIINKIFVFESKIWAVKVLRKEVVSFFGARLFSFGLEELGLYFAYAINLEAKTLLGFNGIFLAKIVLSVIAVILNYIMSKLFIFKKKQDGGDCDESKGIADHTSLQ